MGPGCNLAKEEDYKKPPRFHLDGAFQNWRKRVAEYVSTIKKAYEKGNDLHLSTKFTLIARIIYVETLPEAQKSLVDNEISEGAIDL